MVKDNKIKKEVLRYLKKVGYNLYKILFVSILGFEGDNMIESLTNFKWYMSPTLDNMKIKETISQAFEAIANESSRKKNHQAKYFGVLCIHWINTTDKVTKYAP